MLPLAAGAHIPPTHNEERIEFYKVIYDRRFPASVAFGDIWKARGAAVHAIRGDITGLWFHDLDLQWKKQPLAIAGLTAHGPLFCLERLAWDQGMRVIAREEQGRENGEELFSWVIAPRCFGGLFYAQ